ncbi:MAG TPA: MFS transporter [Dermatophilaceae bacterium]|nr:MFS transporter [Dermatophilaceae bacterium]
MVQAQDGSGRLAISRPQLRPWHFVLFFGLVSLFADMVYEGARSIIGPYLATLGASATIVGAVAGAGEFIGYGLRVVSGYLVQRRGHYWAWTITGYALTVLSVPLIGSTNVIAPALVLYGTERLGKAVRSPAKDTLLSYASTQTGRGTAFGVHQAMDQAGAMAGPLLLAAVLSQHEGNYRLAFGVLIVPGVVVLGLLFWLRHRVPDPLAYEVEAVVPHAPVPHAPAPHGSGENSEGHVDRSARVDLPPLLWQYIGTIGLLSLGIASFPLLAFHAQTQHLLTSAQVPLLFALAMLVDGLSGLLMGRFYDRLGPQVLLVVPVAAGVAAIAFTQNATLIWVGVAVWGLVHGVMDSTVKAVVTELVVPASRSIAFGWLALVRGLGLLAAGASLGFAYDQSITVAVWLILGVNAAAMAVLALVLARLRAGL